MVEEEKKEPSLLLQAELRYQNTETSEFLQDSGYYVYNPVTKKWERREVKKNAAPR